MAVFKFTMLFAHSSAASAPNYPVHRIGGWSESWYVNDTSAAGVLTRATLGNGILPSRAALLPNSGSIVGVRVQQVSPPGPSQTATALYPGTAANLADIPQMGLLCSVAGQGVSNIRRFILRGVPDVMVKEGEYSPSGDYDAAVKAFLSVGILSWNFRGRDLSIPPAKILNVSTLGVVTCQAAVTFPLLGMVRILKSKDTSGTLRGGVYQVSSVGPGTNVFTVLNWQWGTTNGGSVRTEAVVYPLVDTSTAKPNRIVTRRVGRPFTAYRGRRSKRR